MQQQVETEVLEIPFGELVEMVTRVAAEETKNENEAYELASHVVEKILLDLMYQV